MLSATEATIKELEARIKRLESIIQMQGPIAFPPAEVTIKCAGPITIDAPTLFLGGRGGMPAARQGDSTGGGGPGAPQQLIGGSNRVLIAG